MTSPYVPSQQVMPVSGRTFLPGSSRFRGTLESTADGAITSTSGGDGDLPVSGMPESSEAGASPKGIDHVRRAHFDLSRINPKRRANRTFRSIKLDEEVLQDRELCVNIDICCRLAWRFHRRFLFEFRDDAEQTILLAAMEATVYSLSGREAWNLCQKMIRHSQRDNGWGRVQEVSLDECPAGDDRPRSSRIRGAIVPQTCRNFAAELIAVGKKLGAYPRERRNSHE
jgi:hypothetical protein